MYIIFNAPAQRLYDRDRRVSKVAFREWALAELVEHYKGYTVSVTTTLSSKQVEFDETDGEKATEIQVYVSKLWKRWYNDQL